MKEKNDNNLIFSLIFVFCVLLIGISATYAFFTRRIQATGEKTGAKVISGVLDIDFVTSEYINNKNTKLIYDSEIFEKSDKTIFSVQRNTSATVDNVYYNLYLNIIDLPNELKSKYVKWALYDSEQPNSELTPIATGSFENIQDIKKIQLNQARINLPKNEKHNYTLYMWLSYSETENQNEFLEKELKVKVVAEAFTY